MSGKTFPKKPDAVMILEDTDAAIISMAAECLDIFANHLDADNRGFDNNVPKDPNRKMVDHVESFNLPYNDYSMRNLLAEGIHPRFIQKTGSPIREIYEHYKDKIVKSTIVEDLGLTPGGYFLVSVHRQENVDLPERLEKVLDCLVAVRDEWNLPVMVSTHPRTRNKLEALSRNDLEGITFHEPFGYLDYNKLQIESKCVISDSGTISEEASISQFWAVSLRDSIERPEALEIGSMILTGLDPDGLVRSLDAELGLNSALELPEGYEVSDFSNRVLKFLFSTSNKYEICKGVRA
jgi:UDP-N-acetylglucosamine 2-epimerase (non-hydrolysing)